MGLKRKRPPGFEAPDLLALAQRTGHLDNGQILENLDITVSSVNQYTKGYRQTKDTLYLKELALSAQAIYVLAEELLKRANEPATPNQPAPAHQARQLKPTRDY